MKTLGYLSIVAIFLFSVQGCKDSTVSPTDITALLPRDFLWSQTPNMTARYSYTIMSTDTNGNVRENATKIVQMDILSERQTTASGLTYVYYRDIGGVKRTMVADAQNMWSADSTLTEPLQVYLHAPITLNASFASLYYDNTPDAKTIAVNQSRLINGANYNTIVSLRSRVLSDSVSTVQELDTVWVAPNFGVVREAYSKVTTMVGSKSYKNYYCIEQQGIVPR